MRNFCNARSEHRVAKKVFLKFLKTFSTEKVFKPPEALERSVNTEGEAVKSKKGRLNGLIFTEKLGINSATLANFSGSTPEKSQETRTTSPRW